MAQECTSDTGYNSTLILPPDLQPSVDGENAPDGTELRIVSSDGECVAHLTYAYDATTGQSTPIWGKDTRYNPASGIAVGDTLVLQVKLPTSDTWRSTTATYTDRPFNNKSGTYAHDELYMLASLSSSSSDNEVPLFTSTPDTSVSAGQTYSYTVETSDPDGDEITLTASSIPDWLAFTDNGDGSGTLDGTPGSEAVGTYNIDVQVSDGRATNVQSFALTVESSADSGSDSDGGSSGGGTDDSGSDGDSSDDGSDDNTGGTPTSITGDAEAPDRFSLEPAYPNPFNPTVNIPYQVPEATHVTVTIYNMRGQVVTELVDQTQTAGRYLVQWQASNRASGVYICRMQAGSYMETRQLVLLK